MSVFRTRWSWAALAAILAVAAWLRLRHLGLAEYTDDQAIALRIAHDILNGNIRTVGLASSAGAANPPLYVYLAAAIVAVHDGLIFASVTVAIASVVAVALSYVVVRPRFGTAVALTTAALFATAPWAVLYGRHFWQQDYLPVVTVALLWALFVVLERDRTRVAFLVPLLYLVAFQLNMSALTLAAPVVAVLAFRARAVNWIAVLAGAAVGVLSLAPWLAHLAKHRFHDVGLFFANGRGYHGGTVGGGAIEAVRQTVNLASAEGWSFETGVHHQGGPAWWLGRAAGIVVVALLLLAIATTVARAVRRRGLPDIDSRRRALLVVWVVGVCLLYLPSRTSGVGPHYLLVSYPVSFLLAALGLSELAALAGRRGAVVWVSAASAVAAAFVAFTLSFQSFLQRHDGTPGAYDVVYAQSEALANAVRARHLHVGFARAEYLVSGHLNVPDGTPPSQIVQVRDRLHDDSPLPCSGTTRSFGPLEACFPP